MHGGDLQHTYEQLRRAAERIGDNLLELELDPIRSALDTTELRGGSAERWERASTALLELWQWYGALDRVLERAGELCAGRPNGERRRELEALLLAPSITVEQRNVPIDERELLGAAIATTSSSPAELLVRMAGAFDEVKLVLGAVRRAWESLRPRVIELDRSLDGLDELACVLGAAASSELPRLREEVEAFRVALTADPLGVQADAVDALEQRARALHGDLDGLVTLRRTMPQRLERARGELVTLRAQEDAAAAVLAEACRKVAGVDPSPAAAAGADGLAGDLDRIAALAAAAAWDEARDALDAWTRRAAELQADAAALAEKGAAPIRARNELRGLLDAYRGKARALRMLEDPRAHELFEQARDELYTAPTDLREGRRRVRRYQEALAEGRAGREAAR